MVSEEIGGNIHKISNFLKQSFDNKEGQEMHGYSYLQGERYVACI